MLLLITALGLAIADNCHTIYPPREYWRVTTIEPPFKHIEVRKDNHKIGIINTSNVIQPVTNTVFGYINNEYMGYYQLYFTLTTGHYEFVLITETKRVPLGTFTNHASLKQDTSIAITSTADEYVCGDLAHNTLWHIFYPTSNTTISTLENRLTKNQTTGFAQLYCNIFYRCKISNLLNSDGTKPHFAIATPDFAMVDAFGIFTVIGIIIILTMLVILYQIFND